MQEYFSTFTPRLRFENSEGNVHFVEVSEKLRQLDEFVPKLEGIIDIFRKTSLSHCRKTSLSH